MKLYVNLGYKDANAAAAYLRTLLVFFEAIPDPDPERDEQAKREVRSLIKKLEQE